MTIQKIPSTYPSIPTIATIRNRILTVLGPSNLAAEGWRQSVFSPSDIGRDGFGESQVVSCECVDTVFNQTQRKRRNSDYDSEPWQASTTYLLRWLVRVPVDGGPAAYDVALDVEHRIVGALLHSDMESSGMHEIQIEGIRRETVAGEWLLGTITITVGHPYALLVYVEEVVTP